MEGWQACKNQNHPSGNQRSAEVPGAAQSACLTPVNKNYGGEVVNSFVVSSESSQPDSLVIVNADGDRWRGHVSNNGSRAGGLRKQRQTPPDGAAFIFCGAVSVLFLSHRGNFNRRCDSSSGCS